MGDQGGEAVVVAEADLVVGDGVVLVHDGHHAELEQARRVPAGVQVLAAVDEVERRQQHLPGHQPVAAARSIVVDADQPGLADPPPRWPATSPDRPGRSPEHQPSAGCPAAMAPLVTITTWSPFFRWAATSAHSLAMASRGDDCPARR